MPLFSGRLPPHRRSSSSRRHKTIIIRFDGGKLFERNTPNEKVVRLLQVKVLPQYRDEVLRAVGFG